MNLHHLRYFVTLAHLEHYTKAAKQLSITQPSLSHAIAALEEELNVRLFEKDGRNVVLTRWGNVFLKDVEEILAHLDSSVANLKMTGTGNGTIDIGCVRVLGASYVPGLMREFIKANPDKNISYRLHSEGGLSAEIIEGLACQDTVKLKDTLAYPQILFNRRSGLRDIIDGLFAKTGGYPDCIMEIEEDMVVAGLVAQGFGIAVVPHMRVLHDLPLKALKIIEPVPERDFYMATLKGTYFAPLVMSFREFAIDYQYKSKYIF